MKEIKGLEGFLGAKDDKPSKHLNKKQKRKQKRDARVSTLMQLFNVIHMIRDEMMERKALTKSVLGVFG